MGEVRLDLPPLEDRMPAPLTIAVCQPLCMPYDVAANAMTHAATVRSAGARVVVFPELSLIGIPQHASDTAALGMDAYVAGVLESAEEAARQEERARGVAVSHGVWVAMASFAGSTGGGYDQAAGRSAVWSPGGALVTRAGPEPGAVARATLI